jgi:hypothetical protein
MTRDGLNDPAPAWAIRMRRVVDAQPDVPDVRDIIYAPTLMPLRQTLVPFEKPAPGREKWWNDGRIRDQGRNRSCVGHALAAVIDHMRADALIATGEGHVDRTLARPWTSALMLYWLARYHDEWAGEDYSGSSIRGALKGFFYNGVASEQRVAEEHRETRHVPPAPAGNNSDVSWYMTKRLLQEARTLQLGAYYRVRPRLADMHAALGETGAVICSAAIHDGWYQVGQGRPTIAFDPAQNLSPEARPTLHAFVVVGYDGDAFWVQNSWGPNWARKGLARWTYEDWAANVVDAWVLRLAILPQTTEDCGTRRLARIAAYGSRIQRSETHFLGRVPTDSSGPSRLDVLGHLVPFQDGILDRFGPYNVNRQTLQETFELISCRYADGVAGNGKVFADGNAHVPPGERKYQHVLIYFLGGWPNEDRLAADVADAIPGFLENHIYPFFVSWDTPIFRELGLIVERATAEVASYATQTNNRRRDARDRAVEGRIAPAASRLLRALRCSARRIFVRDQPEPDLPFKTAEQGYGAYALSRLFEAMAAGYRDGSLSYHFAAHGFGAQVLVECLAQQGQLSNFAHFSSCTLISPLVASHRLGHRGDLTNSLFDCLMLRGEKPNRRSPLASLDIERLRLVVLGEEALKADRFIDNYGCSWPALWSSVLAHDQFISDRFDKTDEFIRESGGQLGGHPRLRLLALHDEALNFTDKSRRAGLDVECQFVGSRSEIEHSSLHHELGFHPDVLNQLVNEILPKKVGATFAPAGRKIDLHKK